MRKLVLLALVGLAGVAVAVVPSLGSAQATTASFTAVDGGTDAFIPNHWYVTGTTTNAVTVAPGATVAFSYPTGSSSHSAVFTGAQPTSCSQTAAAGGYAIRPAPPLPYVAEPAGWSGTCRFDTPGTYPFHCAFHGEAMSGTITVAAATTPTTPTTPTPSQTTTTGTTTTFGEPAIPAAASSLRAPALQHGSLVRGQINVTAPGSRLVADLLSGPVRVGRTTRHGVGDGTRHFTVRLSATGRRALGRRHRLTLTLRVQVLLAGALGPTTLSRHVTLTG